MRKYVPMCVQVWMESGIAEWHTIRFAALMIFNVLLLLPHLPEMSGLTSRAGEGGRRRGQRQQHKCHARAAHEPHSSQKGNA